jgi:GNAT superfamily N-acetyltransferase
MERSFPTDVLPANQWWRCAAVRPDGSRAWYALVWSTRYPRAARVELPIEEAVTAVGDDAVCVARYGDEDRIVALEITARGAPKAPPLWFVEIRESTARPPAVNLVAFTGAAAPTGALLDAADLPGRGVHTADQLGAVRWYPATGEFDQIYVQPEWRRRTIGWALAAAAGTLSDARDWPLPWADGQRTDMGEKFRNGSPWRHRAQDLTHLAPPMTPETPAAPT